MTTLAFIRNQVSQMLGSMRKKQPAGNAPTLPAATTQKEVSISPIFVFQMGRVGSNSVEHSLRTAYRALSLDVPVYHAHYMSNYDMVEARAKQDLPDPTLFIRDLQLARGLRKAILEDPAAPRLKVISLVRDIIARNVSTFYYALPEFIPDWEQRLKDNSLTVDYLHEVFISKKSYELTALNWFEEQLKPVFDVDVYEAPFPKELGYKIYSSPKADLLVMRLESLSNCAEQAIRQFLGLHDFRMSTVNTGDDRKTGQLQRIFKTKPLPREYVNRMYASKLSRHFYTDAELETFTRYWTEKKEPR
jgi:hypothetical protein